LEQQGQKQQPPPQTTYQKLKWYWFLLGPLALWLFSLISNMIFILQGNNLKGFTNVATLLITCCSRNTTTCCPPAYLDCCNCAPWLPNPQASPLGNCSLSNDINTTYLHACQPWADEILQKNTFVTGDFQGCSNQPFEHWECPNEECLTNPPAAYDSYAARWWVIAAQLALFFGCGYLEYRYYMLSYRMNSFRTRSTRLGLVYTLLNKNYRINGTFASELDFWFAMFIRPAGFFAHIGMAVTASHWAPINEYRKAIALMVVDLMSFIYVVVAYWRERKEQKAVAIQAGEPPEECGGSGCCACCCGFCGKAILMFLVIMAFIAGGVALSQGIK